MRWFRSTIGSLAAVATALSLGLATAGAAMAVTSQPTKEEAGYSFAGGNAHFRYAAASVYLRDASQYSSSIGALGQSVQLWGGGRVYVLGVSDTTTKSAWSPAVAVFNNSTHALVDTGSFGTVSYPIGHTVRESIYYNTATGNLSFTVQDVTSSMAYTSNTVMKRSTKIRIRHQGAPMLFYPAALPLSVPDPHLRRRDHPPSPQEDRVVLAQAQPRAAGPAGAGLPAQRRDIRRAGRRVRRRHRHRLALCRPRPWPCWRPAPRSWAGH